MFNRHLHRAEAAVAHFDRVARQSDIRAMPWHETIIEAELGKARLVVNASGIGADTDESPLPDELLPDNLYVLDLVLKFDTSEVGLQPGDESVRLTGNLLPAHGGSAFDIEQSVTVASRGQGNGPGKGNGK